MKVNKDRIKKGAPIALLLAGLTFAATAYAAEWSVSGNHIYNLNSGNVGIGTADPRYKLALDTGLYIKRPNYNNGFAFGVDDAGLLNLSYRQNDATAITSNILTATFQGNIGIGTANPQYRLALDTGLYIKRPKNDNGFAFGVDDAGLLNLSYRQNDATAINGSILAATFQGNVGIGTTTPAQKLDVAGSIKLNGSIVSDGDICIGACQ